MKPDHSETFAFESDLLTTPVKNIRFQATEFLVKELMLIRGTFTDPYINGLIL